MIPTVHILILAAGASSRMRGSDKLLQTVGSRPMLRHIAKVAVATGAPVAVTLPPEARARAKALAGLDVRIIPVADAAQGMSRSLAAGIAAIAPQAGPKDGVMILPADMPEFTTRALLTVSAVFAADPRMILRGGTTDGQPGHPVIFPRDLWPDLSRLTGDAGGRSVLEREKGRVRMIALPGLMSVTDLDTPEDWATWSAR